MTYFVSHVSSLQRARVHKGGCAQCLEGQGSEPLPKNRSGRTEWSKPFATATDARAYMMKTFAKYKSLGMCTMCQP